MKVYTIKEVSEILQVHDRTVRRYLKSGELEGRNLGTVEKPVWRFTEGDIENYLEKKKVKKGGEQVE